MGLKQSVNTVGVNEKQAGETVSLSRKRVSDERFLVVSQITLQL